MWKALADHVIGMTSHECYHNANYKTNLLQTDLDRSHSVLVWPLKYTLR